jgi:hypothetical protein
MGTVGMSDVLIKTVPQMEGVTFIFYDHLVTGVAHNMHGFSQMKRIWGASFGPACPQVMSGGLSMRQLSVHGLTADAVLRKAEFTDGVSCSGKGS